MEASGELHALVILPPGKEPAVPGALEDGWAPQLVWTIWRRGRSFSCAKIWSPDCLANSLVTVLTVLLQLPVGWMWLNLVVHFPSDRWRSCFFRSCDMTALVDEVLKCQLLVSLIICDRCFPIFYWTASSQPIELLRNLWGKNHFYFAVISFDFICLSDLPKVTSSTSECPATGDLFCCIHRSLGFLHTLPTFILSSTAFA